MSHRLVAFTATENLAMTPVEFFKCLADETRLRSILLVHIEGELCVCELMAALQESQPKVSRHLAQLRQGNLLLDRRQGQWVFYRLNPCLPPWAATVIATTTAENLFFVEDNLKRLRAMGDRPARSRLCC